MKTALRKMGNSLGVILPKPILADAAIQSGDSLDVTVEEGRIVLAPIKRNPREGWAEAAAEIAAAEEIDHEWLDFPNDADETWEW
jgi:antitoxin MazE